jgi:predicted O-methyltransferase YrrM
MSIPFGQDEGVKIDVEHAQLLAGLVMSNKPKTVLEFGLGGGQSTDAILAGLQFNQQMFEYTVVDNWFDWAGIRPIGVTEKYGHLINIVDSAEKDFVFSTDKKFDFIMSDGDHFNTNQWFEYVYETLLNPGGILIYHDVMLHDVPGGFPNLREIYYKCKTLKLNHHLFNATSRPNDRCWRGFLVIFKE